MLIRERLSEKRRKEKCWKVGIARNAGAGIKERI